MDIFGRVTGVYRRDEERLEVYMTDAVEQRYYVTVFSPLDEEVEPGDEMRLTGVRDIMGHTPGVLTFKSEAYRTTRKRAVPLSGRDAAFGVRVAG